MQLFLINETCERLRIGRSALYDKIRKGEISVTKIGSRTLISESEIERIISEGTRRAQPSAGRV